MKDFWFSLKVSDLLQTSWTKDTTVFQHKFSTIIPWLDKKKWISVTVWLESMNKEDVLIPLTDATCFVQRICDRFANEFLLPLSYNDITIEASVWVSEWEDDILKIDPRTELLDLERVVCEYFLLNEPLKILCVSCIKKDLDDESEEQRESIKNQWIKRNSL